MIKSVPLGARNLPATTYELLARTATAHPADPALYLLGEDGRPWREATCWTYQMLLERVLQAANAFLDLGLPEGGVVALMLPNLGATYAALLGAQAVGVVNPVNPMLSDDHLVEILTLTGAQILLAPGPGLSADLWDKARRIVDGWLLTGDLRHVDADGYVYLTGRAKDLVIRGGHNIDPRPVEDALLSHPEVAAAAVVGAPDPHSGEVPVAYLVLTRHARSTVAELHAWATAHAPEPAAVPRAIHLIDALPTTVIGKIYKPGLVLDAIRRRIVTELDHRGLTGAVEATSRAGSPHAEVRLRGADAGSAERLSAELDRYSFSHEVLA